MTNKKSINQKAAELASSERCESTNLYCSCIFSAVIKMTEWQNKRFIEALKQTLSSYFTKDDFNNVIDEITKILKQPKNDKFNPREFLLSNHING